MRWAGIVVCVEEMHKKLLLENLNGEDLGVNGRAIFKEILRKLSGNSWTGFVWLKIRTNYGLS